jgi:hypothetical protein
MGDHAQDSWESLIQLFDTASRRIARARGERVEAVAPREAARELVQQYFRSSRGDIMNLRVRTELLDSLDDEMHALLQLSRRRSRRHAYVTTLGHVRNLIRQLEADREQRLGEIASSETHLEAVVLSSVERSILTTLQRLSSSAALSYEQAIRDLHSADRISFRGTANELREALREVLDQLAPKSDVMAAPGFQLEPGQTQPTYKQRVRYLLRLRGRGATARASPEQSVALADELFASLTRAASERGSISTHVTSGRGEVQQMKMYIDSVLGELLEIHS